MVHLYDANDVELPWLTSCVIGVPSSLVLAVAIGVAIMVLLKDFFTKRTEINLVINVVVLLMSMAAVLMFTLALYLPCVGTAPTTLM